MIVGKLQALIKAIRREEIEALPPAHRQRLAAELRHMADLAEPPGKTLSKAGVLADLHRGNRSHD